jgi:excisionase family DNA binding protein
MDQLPMALNTKARAARKLGVSYSTMVRWIRDDKIETVMVDGRTWVPERALMKMSQGESSELGRTTDFLNA